MGNTQEDEKLWENLKQALQNFLRTESFNKIKQANIWLAEQLQSATLENICIGKRPKFQNFHITGEIGGDVGYRPTETTLRSFYQSFSGYHWLMINENESDLNCCLDGTASYVKKILGVKLEGISSIKDKDKVALTLGANDAAYHQCGANTYIDNERLISCTASGVGDIKEIPIRPIYVITPDKKKIFIGTFFEETKTVEIKIYDTYDQHNRRINNIRQELDYVCKLFKKTSKKSSKKVAKICIPMIVIAMLGIIGYFIYLLVT